MHMHMHAHILKVHPEREKEKCQLLKPMTKECSINLFTLHIVQNHPIVHASGHTSLSSIHTHTQVLISKINDIMNVA